GQPSDRLADIRVAVYGLQIVVRQAPKNGRTQRFHPVRRGLPGQKGIVGADKLPVERKGKRQVVFFPGNVKSDNTALDEGQVILSLAFVKNPVLFWEFFPDQF